MSAVRWRWSPERTAASDRTDRNTTDTATNNPIVRPRTPDVGPVGSSPRGRPRPLGNDVETWTHNLLPLSPFLLVVIAVGVAWWTTRRRK